MKLNLYEKVFLAMAVMLPLQAYSINVLGLGISLDRVILCVLCILFPTYLNRRGMPVSSGQILGLLGIASLALSLWTGSGVDEYVIQFMPSMVQNYVVFMVGTYVAKDNPRIGIIIRYVLISWTIILSVFTLYMLYYYYWQGAKVVPFPFLGDIFAGDAQKLDMMRGRRLFMPLASAPHLGATAGLLGLLSVCIYLQLRRRSLLFVAIVNFTICILTLSRGPIIAVCLGMALLVLVGNYKGVLKTSTALFSIVFSLIVLVCVIFLYQKFQINQDGYATASRLTIDLEEISEGRHLSLRQYGLQLFGSATFWEMVGGQGFGAFLKSGTGAYSFFSNLTLLVETGVFGAAVFTLVFIIPIYSGYEKIALCRNKAPEFLFFLCIISYVQFANLFYELKTVRELWLFTAISYGILMSSPKVFVAGGVRLGWQRKRQFHMCKN